jgi:NAD(P)-dependent dehydrogenase (short-subunit alcohol dehydrogenase family)
MYQVDSDSQRRKQAMSQLSMRFLPVVFGALFISISMTAGAETVLITGANSGIGLEFARQYSERGWNVIAIHRRGTPPATLKELSDRYAGVRVEHMDVTSHADINTLANKLAGIPIDVLINNAGAVLLGDYSDPKTGAAQQFGSLNYQQFDVFMHTNVMGPVMIIEAFLNNIKAGTLKKIINISSAAGSITTPVRYPGMYWYKTSKTALNMVTKNLAFDLSKDGITVVMFHPGGVRIEKLKDADFPGMIEPAESISGMIKVIDGLTMKDTGKFLTHTGDPQPF